MLYDNIDLQQLRDHTERFINRIHSSLNTMPFGIRLIARELKDALMVSIIIIIIIIIIDQVD
jgi:hypothetical protein